MGDTVIARLLGAKEGSAAVEFAVLATFIITFLLAIADFGILYYEQFQVEHAAQNVAVYAVSHGGTSSAINTAVTLAGVDNPAITVPTVPQPFCGCPGGTGIAAAACGATCPDSSTAGTYITVTAQMTPTILVNLPGITNPSRLAAQVTIRLQ